MHPFSEIEERGTGGTFFGDGDVGAGALLCRLRPEPCSGGEMESQERTDRRRFGRGSEWGWDFRGRSGGRRGAARAGGPCTKFKRSTLGI